MFLNNHEYKAIIPKIMEFVEVIHAENNLGIGVA